MTSLYEEPESAAIQSTDISETHSYGVKDKIIDTGLYSVFSSFIQRLNYGRVPSFTS